MKLIEYIVRIYQNLAHPLSVNKLKFKVGKICQGRVTPFKDGVPDKSWLKWFKRKHPQLVLRILQAFDVNRAKGLCLPMVAKFYENLQNIYMEQEFQPTHIWNVDESEANAYRNGVGKVLAARGSRNVHTITSNEREWILVLTCFNANGDTIPHYYIFKGVRARRDYLALCESRSTFWMQKKGWVDFYQFSKWMEHFLLCLRQKNLFSNTSKHLLILDGHKVHLTLEVLSKAKENGIQMLTLPSFISHGLQSLDLACFKPFKVAFRAYRNA